MEIIQNLKIKKKLLSIKINRPVNVWGRKCVMDAKLLLCFIICFFLILKMCSIDIKKNYKENINRRAFSFFLWQVILL